MKKYLCLFIFPSIIFGYGKEVYLSNLNYKNPTLKKIRSDVRHNLAVSTLKSYKKDLKEFSCYFYKVKKSDNFFKIMAKTSLNFDTLISLNFLSSPHDIYTNMKLKVCNMRGVYVDDKLENSSKSKLLLSKKYKIPEFLINYDKISKLWFIAGKKLSREEKGFFYGASFSKPLKENYNISSKYGTRRDPFNNKITFHGGVDMAAAIGEPVFSSASGEVFFAGVKSGYGKVVILKHKSGYETRYGHLSKINVITGDKIKKNMKIGEVGETGRATGPHLHFEVRRNNKHQKPRFRVH